MSEPQVNGPTDGKYIDSIDPDDPQYIRDMRRPAEVKEDVRQMEQRSRVSAILNSKEFRSEIEELIDAQLLKGKHQPSLSSLLQMSELLLPHTRQQAAGKGLSGGNVLPINDIRGQDAMNYTKGERMLRCKVAACYRLVDLNGWSHGIYNHISARLTQDFEHFLINPFGLLYSEVTASSLVKVDMQGDILEPGTTNLGINQAGFTIHSAIHAFRPDIKAIIHVHAPAVVAVSMCKSGLLPISQEALICGDVAYYSYSGIIIDQDERDKVARTLGPTRKVMFLRNHGVLACGVSIEEAYHYLFNVMAACETQVRAMALGLDNIELIPEDIQQKTFELVSQGSGCVDSRGHAKYKQGELEYEALMRLLDNAGYRTGYIFRDPLIKREKTTRSNSEVEIPPTTSSFAYMYEEGDTKYTSPIKQAIERQKKGFKSEWLNTPNAYRKEEIDEVGTPNPKKITRWVAEGEPTNTSTPYKVDTPNQFAPQGENPKELKVKQQQIRKDYYTEKVNAGPQSRLLEGISWEEAEKIKEGKLSGTTDSIIMVGAASKGIIQRDHQHNAVVYRQYYQPNPFENMGEDEVARYKAEIEKKSRGDTDDELTPGPDGKLISSDERMQQIRKDEAEVDRAQPKETNIDDVLNDTGDGDFQRSASAKQPVKKPDNFARSQSERKPKRGEVNGDDRTRSPAKSDTMRSTSSGDDETKGESPSKDKKKKKKFRMPSFSKKKEKK